jgi:Transposase Tn5 dimerisation domain
MAGNPSGSLPEQMGGWNELRAAYRLLKEAEVTHEALSVGHWGKTYQEAQAHEAGVILWIQDTTELNYNAHQGTRGLGGTSHAKVQGLMMHSALVVVPQPGNPEVLGLGWQHVWSRAQPPEQSRFTNCESDKWSMALEQVGAVSEEQGQRWVSVGDRESDVFAYLQRAKALGWDCLSRVAQNRVICTPSGERDWLKRFARPQPVQAYKPLELRGRSGQPKRTVELNVSWSALRLHPPQSGNLHQADPIECWCIRCWETAPNGLEWMLLTSLDPAQFSPLDQLEWYAARWLIEEYHKCLKTGCAIEARQLTTAKRLITLTGFLSIVAVRLLQLRTLSRQQPHRNAAEVVPEVMVRVLVIRLKLTTAQITLGEFWGAVARLGGFIGRKSDGQPGWQTLWRGWSRLQDLCWGVELGAGGG